MSQLSPLYPQQLPSLPPLPLTFPPSSPLSLFSQSVTPSSPISPISSPLTPSRNSPNSSPPLLPSASLPTSFLLTIHRTYTHVGVLLKQGDHYKNWRPRHCCISTQHQLLLWFKNEAELNNHIAKGEGHICGYVSLSGSSIFLPTAYIDQPYAFELETSQKRYFLAASTNTELSIWLSNIFTAGALLSAPLPSVPVEGEDGLLHESSICRMYGWIEKKGKNSGWRKVFARTIIKGEDREVLFALYNSPQQSKPNHAYPLHSQAYLTDRSTNSQVSNKSSYSQLLPIQCSALEFTIQYDQANHETFRCKNEKDKSDWDLVLSAICCEGNSNIGNNVNLSDESKNEEMLKQSEEYKEEDMEDEPSVIMRNDVNVSFEFTLPPPAFPSTSITTPSSQPSQTSTSLSPSYSNSVIVTNYSYGTTKNGEEEKEETEERDNDFEDDVIINSTHRGSLQDSTITLLMDRPKQSKNIPVKECEEDYDDDDLIYRNEDETDLLGKKKKHVIFASHSTHIIDYRYTVDNTREPSLNDQESIQYEPSYMEPLTNEVKEEDFEEEDWDEDAFKEEDETSTIYTPQTPLSNPIPTQIPYLLPPPHPPRLKSIPPPLPLAIDTNEWNRDVALLKEGTKVYRLPHSFFSITRRKIIFLTPLPPPLNTYTKTPLSSSSSYSHPTFAIRWQARKKHPLATQLPLSPTLTLLLGQQTDIFKQSKHKSKFSEFEHLSLSLKWSGDGFGGIGNGGSLDLVFEQEGEMESWIRVLSKLCSTKENS